MTSLRAVLDTQISEAQFAADVRHYAALHGWLIYWTWNSKHSPKGMPDLVLCRPPRVLFCELKRETGKPTREQVRWLDTLNDCPGVEAYLWKPSDWKTIEQLLAKEAS